MSFFKSHHNQNVAKNLKRWVFINISMMLIILSTIVLFNFLMDPLWCFQHKNFLQTHQEGFNDRQQKINVMHFSPSFDYNTLLIGSSRVSIHNANAIKNEKAFNIAMNGMTQDEFNDYIEYAKKINHNKPFKYIIIGLDFTSIDKDSEHAPFKEYIQTAQAPLYRYKTLLTYDILHRSIVNVKNALTDRYKKRFKTYDADHIGFAYPTNPDKVESIVQEALDKNQKRVIHYQSAKYCQILERLKANNPDTKFLVFTTPLPGPIVSALLTSEHNKQMYRLWIQDLVKTFGSVHHYFYLNAVTKNYTSTFVDEGHYTTEIGNCIDDQLFGRPCSGSYSSDFGIVINQDNVSTVNLMPGL